MATNPFFHNNEVASEQNLLEELTIESIQIAGKDMYYLPRTNVNVSDLYREEQVARFEQSFLIEMYVENISGFGGDREFLSTFGQDIKDRITFSVAIRRFAEEIGNVLNYKRPREGDLIYMPMTGGLYEIRFVEPELNFYQLGKLYTYNLVCESFVYNNEEFTTGIPGVDSVQPNYSTDLSLGYLLDTDGNPLLDEHGDWIEIEEYSLAVQDPTSQNEVFDAEIVDILDFSEQTPFSEY